MCPPKVRSSVIFRRKVSNFGPGDGSLVSPEPAEGHGPAELRDEDVCPRGGRHQSFKVYFVRFFIERADGLGVTIKKIEPKL